MSQYASFWWLIISGTDIVIIFFTTNYKTGVDKVFFQQQHNTWYNQLENPLHKKWIFQTNLRVIWSSSQILLLTKKEALLQRTYSCSSRNNNFSQV